MKSETHKLMSVCMACGWFACTGLHMFIQDWLGLEGYIVWARLHWIHMSWAWGAVLFAVPILFYYQLRTRIAFLLKANSDGH